MKKIILHGIISLLFISSPAAFGSEGSDSSPDSTTSSGTNSLSDSPYRSPRVSRNAISLLPNVKSGGDQVILSRELSPSSHSTASKKKDTSLDHVALVSALTEEKQKKRDEILRNCAHLETDEDRSARKGLDFLKEGFSESGSPLATPHFPSRDISPSQPTIPEIKIVAPVINEIPDKVITPVTSPHKQMLQDPKVDEILNDLSNDLSKSDKIIEESLNNSLAQSKIITTDLPEVSQPQNQDLHAQPDTTNTQIDTTNVPAIPAQPSQDALDALLQSLTPQPQTNLPEVAQSQPTPQPKVDPVIKQNSPACQPTWMQQHPLFVKLTSAGIGLAAIVTLLYYLDQLPKSITQKIDLWLSQFLSKA